MSTTIYTELFCQFCKSPRKNKNSKSNHERLCKLNPNKQSTHFHTDYNKTRKPTNQFIKSVELGIEKPTVSETTRKLLSDRSKSQEWSDERRKNHSLAMKNAVLNNPESYSKSNRGRVKHIKKYGLTFDGRWELKFYEWCIDNNIKVYDNKKFFSYVWNNSEHLYNPDFYLPDYDIYVEVKGYYDDRDICKWSYFYENLCIFDKSMIKLINQNKLIIGNILDNKKDFI